ncbi:MAG: Maf family protein [Oscillospiraceae bacterium]|nr:Maf family protein [Oscillospiraceae bacterium]
MAHIVLASASPRRQELLQRMGITEFDIRVPEAEETYPEGLSPRQIVEYISREKADAAVKLCGADEIVITADTMVFLDDARLGKPTDEADALRMLTALQGRHHTVCTGVTVRQGDHTVTESEETEVIFRPATQRELLAYIATGEPMDKAGAYGIQGKGSLLVEGIRGDFFNVMGLPLLRLSRMLEQFGITCLG